MKKIFKNKLFITLTSIVSVITLALGITFGCVDFSPKQQDETSNGATATQPTNDLGWIESSSRYDTSWKGSGTKNNPYIISTARELAGLSYMVYIGYGSSTATNLHIYKDKYFKQTADIDLSEYWWQPIGLLYQGSTQKGRYFSGNYDGGGHTVSGIYTHAGTTDSYSHQGLFGYVKGESSTQKALISNIGVVNSFIKGHNFVGGVVGCIDYVTVSNCYNTCSVTGRGNNVGGVIGANHSFSTVTKCYNSGSVSGDSNVGGVVGDNYDYATVNYCYNTGSVIGGGINVGGVVGNNNSYSKLITSYNTGSVSGVDTVGGVVGLSQFSYIYNTFNVGSVQVNNGSGGVIGSVNSTSYYSCYYGGECSLSVGIGIIPNDDITDTTTKITNLNSTSYAKGKSWYTDTSNWSSTYPWDFENDWDINSSKNNGYPILLNLYKLNGTGSVDDPYIIASASDLKGLADNVNNEGKEYEDKYFKQTANINLGGYEWTPIGHKMGNSFRGNYDGADYSIIGMTILQPYQYSGLFGYSTGSLFKNINVKDAVIENTYSNGRTGGILGFSENYPGGCANFEKCSFDGMINVSSGSAGGIGGYLYGSSLTNCRFDGQITGSGGFVGGIVGNHDYIAKGTISDCVVNGYIESTNRSCNVGGIVGRSYAGLNMSTTIVNVTIKTTGSSSSVGSLIGYILNSTGSYSKTINDCAGFGMIYSNSTEKTGSLFGHTSQTSGITFNRCSFVGSSNKALNFAGTTSTAVEINNCYSQVNNKGVYKGNDFSGWTIVKNNNKNLPMQNALYSVAEGGQTSDYIITELEKLGFVAIT